MVVEFKFHVEVSIVDCEGRPGNMQNVSKSSSYFDVGDESGCRKDVLVWGSGQFLAFDLNGICVVSNFQKQGIQIWVSVVTIELFNQEDNEQNKAGYEQNRIQRNGGCGKI